MNRFSVRLVGLLLLFWLLLTPNLNVSWFMYQDTWKMSVPSSVRNYTLYPPEVVRTLVTWTFHPVEPEQLTFYTNHPPMSVWLSYLSTQLFGFHPFAIRWVFVVLTWLTGVLLYVLTRRLFNAQVAFWTLACFALPTMVNYFGRVPGQDQTGLLPAMLFACVMVNWLRFERRWHLPVMMMCAFVVGWSSWTGVTFVAALGMAGFWLGSARHRWQMVAIAIVTVLGVVSLGAYYEYQRPGFLSSLLNAFVWRSSNATNAPESVQFTAWEWVIQNLSHILFFATPSLLILSLWGIWPTLRRGSRFTQVILLALFAGPMAYLLVFRNATYIHHFYKLLLMPSLCISAGLIIAYPPRKRAWRALLVVLVVLMPVVSGYVFRTLHQTHYLAFYEGIVDFINQSDSQSVALWIYGEANPPANWAFEFYTNRPIAWGVSPEEAQEDMLYVYCNDTIPATLQTAQPFLDGRCVALMPSP